MYSPYELLAVKVNGESTFARPLAFDSEITDFDAMKNAAGAFVVPSQISVQCPACGAGMLRDVTLNQPPFAILDLTCNECRPATPTFVNPFTSPIGVVRNSEPTKALEQLRQTETTVAERQLTQQPIEPQDDLRAEYDLAKLQRVPNEKLARRKVRKQAPEAVHQSVSPAAAGGPQVAQHILPCEPETQPNAMVSDDDAAEE